MSSYNTALPLGCCGEPLSTDSRLKNKFGYINTLCFTAVNKITYKHMNRRNKPRRILV